ncbi:MAG TPA: DUF3866 family protein [Bacillota bacterium]|nr:DUF3866 family protein [Bacillota bacterium]
MINSREGSVHEIFYCDDTIQEILVEMGQTVEKAINYRFMTGTVQEGDRVILNTTALDLGLGSGGWHFVMSILTPPKAVVNTKKHIMKLRYTPFQLATGSCEEQGSPFYGLMKDACSLEGMPVLVGELHSMLPIVATYIKQKNRDIRLVYIMTDKAALPLAFSHHVRTLKKICFLAGTITIGQAFGGDLEAINIYSGLVAAKKIFQADLAIVCMGPGITGTSTMLGFTGMEQTEILHATASLEGIPVLIPRISSSDQRARHQGLSHHTRSVLKHTLISVHIPILEEFRPDDLGLHHWHLGEQSWVGDLRTVLTHYPEPIQTMGKSLDQDPLFFHSVALAADFGLFLTMVSNDPYSPEDLSRKWEAWTSF